MEQETGGNMMQERQYKILKLLYRSDGFVTVERLAEDVNCSLKTIRNDLKQLGSFLEEYGLGKVVSKSNKGVCLIKDKDWDTAKQAWNDVNQMELYGTDKHFQILELLLKQRSIQKMKLEKRLLISRLDAEKATSQASVWLTAHHVAVTCKRGQGLQIECSEYYWRMAMWELFADISRKRQEFGDQTLKNQTEKFLWGFDMAGVTAVAYTHLDVYKRQLQTISADLYEAADISGANSWQKFLYITLPELMPTIITTCMLRIIWVFNNVEVLYLMTGGGPGHSSMTVSLVAYIKAQKSLDFGQGSTIAIYGTLFMILFMTIYLKLTRRGDEDEKD